MKSLNVEGSTSLNGSVDLSGDTFIASKLILASLFTTEPVIISGVPKAPFIDDTLNLISSIGVSYEWLDEDRLLINASGISGFRIPFETGTSCPNALLLVAPLVFRFGEAILPKPSNGSESFDVLDQFVSDWKSLGMKVSEDNNWINIVSGSPHPANIGVKDGSCLSTENALISSMFVGGKTIISNASEDIEIDNYISFLNSLGASVERIEPSRIEITGQTMFKGTSFKCPRDNSEAVYFSVAALITGGTVTINSIDKVALAPFINVLTNIGANYDFSGDSITVWHGGEDLKPVDVNTRPAPGLSHNWVYALALLLTRISGISSVTPTEIPVDVGFFSDLNRMGANITPVEEPFPVAMSSAKTPATKGVPPDFSLKIEGPSSFNCVTLDIAHVSSGIALLLAALTCSGKGLIRGSEIIDYYYPNFVKKLISLGAQIS